MKGNIIIKPYPETNAIKNLELPFEISLGIVPLKARLHCIEYPLVKEQNHLRLCCDKIESKSQISIEIINYYIHNRFLVAFELEPLEDNEARKPEMSIDDNKKQIILKFPSVKTATRCKFNIKIALSQNFVYTILCDLVIMPLAFVFETYNFTTQQFQRKDCPIVLIRGHSKLILRIQTMFRSKKYASISYYFPKSITLDSSIKFDDKFEVLENLIIPIDLTFNQNYKKPSYGSISLNIGGEKATIEFSFINDTYFPSVPLDSFYSSKRNDEFLGKYPCYYFNEEDKEWFKITDNKKLIDLNNNGRPNIIVSPFSSYCIPHSYEFRKIDYKYSYYKNNYYVSADPHKGIDYIQLTKPIKEHPILIYKKNDSYKTSKITGFIFTTFQCAYFSIIGYVIDHPDCWFPAFDTYPNIEKIDYLPYTLEKNNVENAIQNINSMLDEVFPAHKDIDINNSFTSDVRLPTVQTNFVFLLTLLCDRNIVMNIEMIIDKMPNNAKNQFQDILLDINPKIKSNEFSDDMCTIISHNLIIKFVNVFSDRYKEIQSHDFLIDYPLSKEEVSKQIDIASNTLFNFDQSKSNEKSINTQIEFSKITDDFKKISLPQISDKLERQECFIISEKDQENPIPCKSIDELGKFKFDFTEDTESNTSENIDDFTFLPPIKIPDTFSILNLNEFYSTCSQGAIVLPTYIKCQSINSNNQKESELYFATLLDIYNEVTKTSKIDKSIVSFNINYFIDSFKNCVRRLRCAGISFKKYTITTKLL